MTRKDISSDDLRRMMVDWGIQVRKLPLHGSCRAVTRKHADGYLILIDDNLSFDTMLDALHHELRHIILGHLDNDILSDHEKEQEVQLMPCIHIIDSGECRKKIYSVS